MKNIILLFSVFFSLSAFGAVKYSITGLEGWGKKGVLILVEDYTEDDKNFPLKAIKTKVELRLLKEGIKSNKDSDHLIIINAQPNEVGDRVTGYSVIIEANRSMEFKAPDNTGKLVTYRTDASSKYYGGNCGSKGLISFIDSSMDDLLLDYLKANPKKP